jgi:hypothetical protein
VSDQSDRVRMVAEDARSGDDLVNPGMLPMPWPGEPPLDSPLDKETLDEQASTQMGG